MKNSSVKGAVAPLRYAWLGLRPKDVDQAMQGGFGFLLFKKGFEAALEQGAAAVVTDFDLYQLGQNLVNARAWQGELLQRVPRHWNYRRLNSLIGGLEERHVLRGHTGFRQRVWRVENAPSVSAEASVCIADPFCYLAYGSAMFRHQLINEDPSELQFLTPARGLWRSMREEQLTELLARDEEAQPLVARILPREKVERRSVQIHETAHPTIPTVRDSIRIATIGSTFVDMLSEPGRCGGMVSVLEVWKRHARNHLDEIVPAITAADAKIVKVRAGYILNENLGLDQPDILAWAANAQRGGSRKLDPDAPYAPTFSERWMLSLNI